ncbi:hypothetical protein OV079_28240 [Nannocystis pusilla]|uniref:Uncharacterized protein n=1 Tax=Nannocystis pusilla TaxID=889268 RepID=A0A9X3IZC6_9BACT|nr:hypothetical protein [Nannocystis pusilla]MCY1009386.1 hypothetical protein [Nannocystis pusilla]
MNTHERLSTQQREFFNLYIHESAVRPRGWVSGLWNDGVSGHLTNVGNQFDESGARREFTHRRLRLTADPPAFRWR